MRLNNNNYARSRKSYKKKCFILHFLYTFAMVLPIQQPICTLAKTGNTVILKEIRKIIPISVLYVYNNNMLLIFTRLNFC